jgi:hypothetical protein
VVIGSRSVSRNDYLSTWDEDCRIQRAAKLRAPDRILAQQFTSEGRYLRRSDGLIDTQRLLD